MPLPEAWHDVTALDQSLGGTVCKTGSEGGERG